MIETSPQFFNFPLHSCPEHNQETIAFQIPSEIPGKNPFDISKFLEEWPVNVPGIFSIYHFRETAGYMNKKRRRRLYQKLYRKILMLEEQNLLKISKSDGILWLLRGPGYSPCIVDNMHGSRIAAISAEFIPPKKQKDIYTPPKKRLREQMKAIAICNQRMMLWYPDRKAIQNLYSKYLERYQTKTLTFTHGENNSDPIITRGPCRTRFTDKGRHIGELIRYQTCWETASRLYDTGVVIGLTTDPKRFENIYHANKHFGSELNRFLTTISYHLPKPKHYICSYEFTKTGILHGHLALFGNSFLHSPDRKQELKWIARRWCQGQRVSSEEIRKDPHWKTWHRVHTDSRKDFSEEPTENTQQYLGKSLVDQLNSELYWTFDTKYFSCSKNLLRII